MLEALHVMWSGEHGGMTHCSSTLIKRQHGAVYYYYYHLPWLQYSLFLVHCPLWSAFSVGFRL